MRDDGNSFVVWIKLEKFNLQWGRVCHVEKRHTGGVFVVDGLGSCRALFVRPMRRHVFSEGVI